MREEFTRVPTEFELGWAVGLFEGEGSAILVHLKAGGETPLLTIAMTDLDRLELFSKIMGGTVGTWSWKPPVAHHKVRYSWRSQSWVDFIRLYEWSSQSWVDFIRLYEWMYPWLGPRRQKQMDIVMAARPDVIRGHRFWGDNDCPPQPVPTSSGYQRHRRRGEKPCAICLESYRLFEDAKRKRLRAAGA